MTSSTAKVGISGLTSDGARGIYPSAPVIPLPMGRHKDQGPHAPICGDLSADAIAERITDRAPDCGAQDNRYASRLI